MGMENKKKIRLKFTDTYFDFKPEEFLVYKLLKEQFDVELVDDPDYVIAMSYGHEHLKYDAIKIFWTGENDVPDFNLFDYAIGFDHLAFGDRYLRVPLYPLRAEFAQFRKYGVVDPARLLNRKFCSFVVSNSGGDPIRTQFFNELSKYKKIDSGGRYLNNVGGPVKDKGEFISHYKFNIAFENSSYPGYVTEKIMDAYSRWSVPVYWGDPLVGSDFRVETMVRVLDKDDIDRAIEEIVRLDNDDEAYLSKCMAECLVYPDRQHYVNKLRDFLCPIFLQEKSRARRVCSFGFQRTKRQSIRAAFAAYDRSLVVRHPLSWLRRKFLTK